MKRCFVSIDIPEELKRDIEKIQNLLPDFQGRKTEPKNLHLTLKFLGEIDEKKVEEVKQKLGEINFNKFESEIDSIGVFSEKFVRIVWLHLTNCGGLQKKVDGILSAEFKSEYRFMSHLTIARVKSLQDKKNFLEKLNKIKSDKMKFGVDSFRLKKSILTKKGPIYKTIEEYKLKI